MDYPKSVPNVGLVNGKFVDEDTAAGVVGSLIPSAWGNAVTDEILNVIKATQIVPDETSKTQLATAIRIIASALVGGTRGAKMSVTEASAAASLTADEVTVKSALGAQAWLLANFSKTVDLSKVGAGGMDTGVAPANGFVALYAIYNPTAGASALLAVNATSMKAPEVYGGANMPAGYTASALVGVYPVSGTLGQFAPLQQIDRDVFRIPVSVYNSSAAGSVSYTPLSISSAVPINARSIYAAWVATESTPGAGISMSLASNAAGVGAIGVAAVVTGQTSASSIAAKLLLTEPQTIYYATNAVATGSRSATIVGYSF